MSKDRNIDDAELANISGAGGPNLEIAGNEGNSSDKPKEYTPGVPGDPNQPGTDDQDGGDQNLGG